MELNSRVRHTQTHKKQDETHSKKRYFKKSLVRTSSLSLFLVTAAGQMGRDVTGRLIDDSTISQHEEGGRWGWWTRSTHCSKWGPINNHHKDWEVTEDAAGVDSGVV